MMNPAPHIRITLFVLASLAWLLSACATNPVTGGSDFVLMSEDQEVSLGQKYNTEILEEMPAYPDPVLEELVQRVGKQLASSVDHYNKAVGSLERNVLPGARKFVELGVHEKKKIEKLEALDPVPRTMIESSADEDDAADLASNPNDKTLQ